MEKKLERNPYDKMLGGVASGTADYLNIEVSLSRILFICLGVFGPGVFVYIILWIVLPKRPYGRVSGSNEADYRVYEGSNTAQSIYSSDTPSKPSYGFRYVAGVILIALGSFLLVNEFFDLPDWISFGKLWPLIFVAIGLVILMRPSRKKEASDLPKKEMPFENNEKTASAEDPVI